LEDFFRGTGACLTAAAAALGERAPGKKAEEGTDEVTPS
jgi:hypothetical protein